MTHIKKRNLFLNMKQNLNFYEVIPKENLCLTDIIFGYMMIENHNYMAKIAL